MTKVANHQSHDRRGRRTFVNGRRNVAWLQALAIAALLTLGLGAGIFFAWRVSVSVDVVRKGTDSRTGAIVDVSNGRCRSFDNITGRTSEDQRCDRVPKNLEEANRRGTTARIDAISKSFFHGR
jgi:hypothetical protein